MQSVDFETIRLHTLIDMSVFGEDIEDTFTFVQRMNIVAFHRLVSQHLQIILTNLVYLNGGTYYLRKIS